MASLCPQFTEQPAQLPRGLEGGALQELTCPSWSLPGGPPAAVLGGPVSLDGDAGELLSFDTQAASDTATSTPAASDGPHKKRQQTVLIASY
jgi:hypothetical protein